MSMLSNSTEPRSTPSSRLSPDTRQWLYSLTENLPNNLLDSKDLETELPEDAFTEDVRRLMHFETKPKNVDDENVPMTKDDAAFVEEVLGDEESLSSDENVANEMPPQASLQPHKKRRHSNFLHNDPNGYDADYSFAESLRSNDIPEQRGEWEPVPRSREDKRTLRLLVKAERERLRRQRLKKKREFERELQRQSELESLRY